MIYNLENFEYGAINLIVGENEQEKQDLLDQIKETFQKNKVFCTFTILDVHPKIQVAGIRKLVNLINTATDDLDKKCKYFITSNSYFIVKSLELEAIKYPLHDMRLLEIYEGKQLKNIKLNQGIGSCSITDVAIELYEDTVNLSLE
jgi:hypothetical protein